LHAADAALFALLVALTLALYVASCPSVPGAWDTGEMQSVPYVLGVSHPTGFPLYTLIGYVFSHVFAIGTVAFRLNVLGSVSMSCAIGLLFTVMRALGIPRFLAAPAALWAGLTHIVWLHGARSEVHDLAFALLLGVLLAAVVFVRTGSRSALLWGAAAYAAAVATHSIAVLAAPALLVALVLRRKNIELRTLAAAALVAASGALLYLYMPLRSAYVVARGLDPTIGLQGLNGALITNYGDTRVPENFVRYVTGADFSAGNTLATVLDAAAWQNHLWALFQWVDQSFGAYAIVAAALGAAAVARANWRLALVVTLFCFAVVPFIDAYTLEGDPDRYRFLPYAGVAIALGASGGRVLGAGSPAWRQIVVELFLAGSCVAQFLTGRGMIGSSDGGPHDLIVWTAKAVPPGALLVTRWLDATPLGYGALVDGEFKGRIVVAGWWDDYAKDYCQWSARYPVYIMIDGVPNAGFKKIRRRDASHTVYRFDPARGCVR
jgi:hypothetical protein